ncbi:MAG: response regulator transcription factor [Candidatus Methanosuratincola sp.]
MQLIRTLLVDDSPEFLDAAERFLSSDPNIEIVGSALSGKEAIEQIAALNPDLVLMDLAMPGINGLETTRRIKAEPEAPRVIILTLHDNPEYRAASESVNADGFVAKSDFGVELIPLIRLIFEKDGVTSKVTA